MSIPYIGFGNDTLDKSPEVKEGDEVHCPHCNQRHLLECCLADGVKSNLIMFYKCGGATYLGAIRGRLVAHTEPDCGGEI